MVLFCFDFVRTNYNFFKGCSKEILQEIYVTVVKYIALGNISLNLCRNKMYENLHKTPQSQSQCQSQNHFCLMQISIFNDHFAVVTGLRDQKLQLTCHRIQKHGSRERTTKQSMILVSNDSLLNILVRCRTAAFVIIFFIENTFANI